MADRRLSKDDWIAAGFEALADSGYEALRAEALARRLKTTKGSFYWHFKGLQEYKLCLLERWQSIRAEDIITQLGEVEPGFARIHVLLGMARKVDSHDTPIQAEHAIREWARYDPDAAQRVSAVDKTRIVFLAEQFKAMGVTNPSYPRALYASYIGARTLATSVGTDPDQDLQLILDCLLLGVEKRVGLLERTDTPLAEGDVAPKDRV